MSTALDSRILDVTVYRSGARVVRVAELPATPKRVRLVRLPLTMDDGSVRARVDGEGVATDLRVTLEVPPVDVGLAAPDDRELQAAQLEVARLRAEVERVSAMIVRVQSIAVLARPKGKDGEPPAPSPTDARRALLLFRSEEQERLSDELATLERALTQAERANATLRDRAARASTAKNPKTNELWKSVIVTLDGAAKGLLRLEYMVPGARWSPSYSIAVAGTGRAADVVMRAAVAQRTGEDWTGANLILSTADADRWTELPVLKSVRIGRAQATKPPRGWREPPMGALELYADFDRAFGVPAAGRSEPAYDYGTTTVSEDDVTMRISAPRAYDDEKTPVEDMRTMARLPASESAAGYGGAPRPPQGLPSNAPMAAAAFAPPPPRAGGIMAPLGALLESAAAAPGAAAKMRRASSPARELAKMEAPSGPEIASGLDLQALAYGRLRMLPPDASGRGSLVAASAASLYLEALGVAVSVDVLAVIRVAVQRASIGDDALPPGHEALVRAADFDYAYVANGAVNVPSDGVFHVLPIAAHTTDARLHYVAVPRETEDVFRVLELTSPIDAALPAGPIDVYQGGSYLMTSRLPPTPPRGKVRLGLGVEQAIKIARNTTFAEKSTGLLGGGLSLVHEIDVEIVNGTGRSAELEVRERLPITQKEEKDIEVTIEAAEPGWKEWTQEQTLQGGYRWSISVEPGQKRKLYAKYVVKISSKQELVGGNRREG